MGRLGATVVHPEVIASVNAIAIASWWEPHLVSNLRRGESTGRGRVGRRVLLLSRGEHTLGSDGGRVESRDSKVVPSTICM